MASLHRDKRPGNDNLLLMFRWGGRQYRRSCKTDSRREARALESRVEETIRLLEQGRLEMPPGADPAIWIMSGGKIGVRHRASKDRFGDICDRYFKDQLEKAESTRMGEQIHIRHLKREFGEKTTLDRLDLKKLQDYVSTRLKQKFRGKTIGGKTVRKELVTFRQIWAWAKVHKIISDECPLYDDNHRWAVNIPKPEENEPFMTWDQIERRGDSELWKYLYLDEKQIAKLLKFVKETARHDFIYPMFVFTAYTGARRSEIVRSEIKDWDFDSGQVRIRERKRRKNMAMTFRMVPIHDRLREVMQPRFAQHQGEYAIGNGKQLTRNSASKHFSNTLEESKWEVVRGFHVLRHSFGSNLARSGKVSRSTIAAWMGHTTEEMKTRYQHLFPQDWGEQINALA